MKREFPKRKENSTASYSWLGTSMAHLQSGLRSVPLCPGSDAPWDEGTFPFAQCFQPWFPHCIGALMLFPPNSISSWSALSHGTHTCALQPSPR